MKKIFAAVSLFMLSFILYSQDITNTELLKNEELTNTNNDIFYYIEQGDAVKVRELLAQGTNVNIVNAEGWSALHAAVKANNTLILKELLSHKKIDMNPVLPVDTVLMDGDNKWYADGQTPLLLASYYGYSDVVSMLLSYGADACG